MISYPGKGPINGKKISNGCSKSPKPQTYIQVIYIPRINTNTFAYTAIKDWNSLPSKIKEINSEKLFKEKIKKHLVEMSNKEEREDFKRD